MTIHAHQSRCMGGLIRQAVMLSGGTLLALQPSATHALPLASWMVNASTIANVARCSSVETILPASDKSLTKAEAILGGAPSRLAQMAARQADALAPAPISPVTLSFAMAGSDTRAAECASYRGVSGLNEVLPAASFRPSTAVMTQPALLIGEDRQPMTAQLDLSRPNVFGSVASAISRTPLDQSWAKVRSDSLSGRAGPWSPLIEQSKAQPHSGKIDMINKWVNARVQFVDDAPRNSARGADNWKNAHVTLLDRKGDCEDYAIAKMKLLEAAGVSQKDMFLVIAYDMVRRADHALLVVRDGDRLVMLDNNTNRITDASLMQDYRPLMSYSGNNAWVHGYRRSTPSPFQLASADTKPSVTFR